MGQNSESAFHTYPKKIACPFLQSSPESGAMRCVKHFAVMEMLRESNVLGLSKRRTYIETQFEIETIEAVLTPRLDGW